MPRKRCPECRLALASCYCHRLPRKDNRWPVIILQDSSESRHALGTARIAALGLQHCQLQICKLDRTASDAEELDRLLVTKPEGPAPALIYPGAEATPLEDLAGEEPRPLLFLDATWRRSRRMLHEFPALAKLPRYSISPDTPSRYLIRRAPTASALSTLEAIVHALETTERRPGHYEPLLQVMEWMIAGQVAHMGEETFIANYGKNR